MPFSGSSTILGAGEIYEIRSNGRTARCTVINRDDVAPEVGARCAAEMQRILTTEVLARQNGLVGLVFDVRRGPAVFGPKTRASLEELFTQAERTGKRIVARVGDAAIQRLQFESLCKDHAPKLGRVARTDAEEAWAAGG